MVLYINSGSIINFLIAMQYGKTLDITEIICKKAVSVNRYLQETIENEN